MIWTICSPISNHFPTVFQPLPSSTTVFTDSSSGCLESFRPSVVADVGNEEKHLANEWQWLSGQRLSDSQRPWLTWGTNLEAENCNFPKGYQLFQCQWWILRQPGNGITKVWFSRFTFGLPPPQLFVSSCFGPWNELTHILSSSTVLESCDSRGP